MNIKFRAAPLTIREVFFHTHTIWICLKAHSHTHARVAYCQFPSKKQNALCQELFGTRTSHIHKPPSSISYGAMELLSRIVAKMNWYDLLMLNRTPLNKIRDLINDLFER